MFLRALMIALSLVSLPAAAASSGQLPSGWRELTEREMTAAQQAASGYYRDVPGGRAPQYAIAADFNGDGREDRALVLVNDRKDIFALFVRLGGSSRYQQLAKGSVRAQLWDWRITELAAGAQPSACGRGLGDSRAPCIPLVRNRWPAIVWSQNEASATAFFWDGRRFRQEFLTD